MLYLPDDEVRITMPRRFRCVGNTGVFEWPELVTKGQTGFLMREEKPKVWRVLIGGKEFQIHEKNFELSNLLERLAREVEDAECGGSPSQ